MGQRPSVLIIEAQQSTRILLEMALSHQGIRVFSAISLSSALLQLRVFQPDLIILGLVHSESMDNQPVSEIRTLCLAPLLALGCWDGAASGFGLVETVPMPFNAEQLLTKVAELLGASSHSGQGAGS